MLQETTPHQKECILCVIFVCVNYLVLFFGVLFSGVCIARAGKSEQNARFLRRWTMGQGRRQGLARVGEWRMEGGGGASACCGRVTLGDNQEEGKKRDKGVKA